MRSARQPVQIHPPQMQDMRDTFEAAMGELAKPYPSIALDAWPIWNMLTGGFRMREYTILCGPTGCGKTTWLANLSAQLLRQQVRHFVMSVETGHTDYMKRMISALVGRDVNTGEAVPVPQLSRISSEVLPLVNADTIQFSLYDNRIPVEQLKADIRFMVEKRGCRIAIIDNLSFFLEVTSARDQVVEQDRVTHDLIVFCKQVDVHLIMVQHPKKTDHGRVESEFDIKGSSTAVQEAHNVLLLNRPRPQDIEAGGRDPWDRELKIAKMRRRGRYVGKSILFKAQAEGAQYVEGGWG